MNFLDISTLSGVLMWILALLSILTIAEHVAVKDANKNAELKQVKDENAELYKLITQQRNNIVELQEQLRRNDAGER